MHYKNQYFVPALLSLLVGFLFNSCSLTPEPVRKEVDLNTGWKTIENDSDKLAYKGFELSDFDDSSWINVKVPHNWDTYYGYLRKIHGNLHGYAWYRKTFTVQKESENKRYFLFFEGVGSYATVWVNGKLAGDHAGGRTTFTLDISGLVHFDKPNLIAVRADHPAEIRDLPWVCGGCSKEVGFSEGSQPLGIFRPVHLIITNDIRIEPFGTHIWNDTTINSSLAMLHHTTEIKNYSDLPRNITVKNILKDSEGEKTIAKSISNVQLKSNQLIVLEESDLKVRKPHLWSTEKPYLYELHTSIEENGKIIDHTVTEYGIRWISWPQNRTDSSNQFLLNGKPVFINGVGEYEHMFGNSHAFTDEQIDARVSQVKAAGFNAFRDAHQPHNIRYQQHFDQDGLLWWTQLSAHIWFDNPGFRKNFKTLLEEWIKERRNSPSNIMWGLQNESTLPEDFARECVEIIRKMDPTTSSQRLVTTCNGGVGTDWNVIQNWSGTYGGDPDNYANEIKEQLLNGEYGAWRSLDLHTEGPFNQNGIFSEDRMTQLLEKKLRLAESVREQCCGQFLWVLSSHDNPGRIQSGEAYRDIDRLGPVNYKGLFTPWGEPLDAFYMYRSNYAPKTSEPMVYIVSHTWPNRWKTTGLKDSITIYSNCDEVELFDDLNGKSLGKIKNQGIGIPFIWRDVQINYNLLYAKGYVNGETVAEDMVVLHHLPEAPGLKDMKQNSDQAIGYDPDLNYIYHVNCGGNDYTDTHGQLWMADRHLSSDSAWGSLSWTDNFENLPAFYSSQRRTFDPIMGTPDWKLIQNFRYGLTDLSFNFPVKNGAYEIELYFTEPWFGAGGSLNCKEWRVFDVAVNDQVVINDLDIWNEAGHDKVLKKVIKTQVDKGMITIHFPEIKSGQAIISAIAIASYDENLKAAPASQLIIKDFQVEGSSDKNEWSVESWSDIGNQQFSDSAYTFRDLPPNLFASTWVKGPYNTGNESHLNFTVREKADIFVALDVTDQAKALPDWLNGFNASHAYLENDAPQKSRYAIYNKRINPGEYIHANTTKGDKRSFTIFIVPASGLAAPTDQRQVTIYSPENAKLKGSAINKVKDGRAFIEIIDNNKAEINWKFNVGLASTYGVHFKFQNNTGGPVEAEMIIVTDNGIEMHREKVDMYYKPGKWRTVKTNTGTTINAGNYWVRLKVNNSKGLLLQSMEIQ